MTIEKLFHEMCDAFPTLVEDGKIFFDHIDVEDGEEITPDYIVLTETQTDPFYADNITYYLTILHAVNLYTSDYGAELSQSIEDFLTSRNIPFTKSVEWLEEIACWFTSYGVDLDPSEVES